MVTKNARTVALLPRPKATTVSSCLSPSLLNTNCAENDRWDLLTKYDYTQPYPSNINQIDSKPSWPSSTESQLAPPQVTTVPSERIAAKAREVAWTCVTSINWSWTSAQSPPSWGLPQQTTAPSARMAANALSVAWICWTSKSWSCTALLSPPIQLVSIEGCRSWWVHEKIRTK